MIYRVLYTFSAHFCRSKMAKSPLFLTTARFSFLKNFSAHFKSDQAHFLFDQKWAKNYPILLYLKDMYSPDVDIEGSTLTTHKCGVLVLVTRLIKYLLVS